MSIGSKCEKSLAFCEGQNRFHLYLIQNIMAYCDPSLVADGMLKHAEETGLGCPNE